MAKDTKTQIMDVAETLFAEYGYDGTSLRMITQAAGVNLASVNYHFGGKETLLEAVYARRINPMNQKRLSCLEDLKQRHDGSKISVALLVDAFVRPALELSRGDGKSFIALLGRSYLEPTAVIQDKVRGMFDEVAERFREEFEKALPEVPAKELYWRLHFMVGVLAYCMAGTDMMRMIASSHIAEKNGPDGLIDRLVRFICNGMEAPVEAQPVPV
ncbi:MAG TPA: TetR/AcrR family transcriptional regulator [Gammaproteobacteria bacterium]|nr:TetR/AcrR family transcriptional regulator [Gammaproteobacteria bacterium]